MEYQTLKLNINTIWDIYWTDYALSNTNIKLFHLLKYSWTQKLSTEVSYLTYALDKT